MKIGPVMKGCRLSGGWARERGKVFHINCRYGIRGGDERWGRRRSERGNGRGGAERCLWLLWDEGVGVCACVCVRALHHSQGAAVASMRWSVMMAPQRPSCKEEKWKLLKACQAVLALVRQQLLAGDSGPHRCSDTEGAGGRPGRDAVVPHVLCTVVGCWRKVKDLIVN